MKIEVVCGTGVGETTLSAFDAALSEVGVMNYNLILLSSMIPKGSDVVIAKQYKAVREKWGDRLYIVKADIRSEMIGSFIAAGLGWYQLGDGRGMFVEHNSLADNEAGADMKVKSRIRKSLQDLCMHRGFTFEGEMIHMAVSSIQVQNKPACALAIAVYQSEGWRE